MLPILFSCTRSRPGDSAKEPVGIETAIVSGMPPDGGLYVPTSLPFLPARVFDPEPLPYVELARLVLESFFPGWEDGSLQAILDKAYGPGIDNSAPCFDDPAICPLKPIGSPGGAGSEGPGLFLLELFHGRTCAFKDLALSVLGGFLRESLDRLQRDEPVLVLTATSGDTGSAALEGLKDIPGLSVAVFYPAGGTSEIQRLQMTTTGPEGRFVAAIRGDFDDAQRAVKAVFTRASSGQGPLSGVFLSSANSINIGRLRPQIVYYVAAWRSLAARGSLGPGGLMHVAVPTGNFGDILAAKYAKLMGLPIGNLLCASNANKVLADFFATGVYDRRRELLKTESPSMDILVSSNLERLLYLASGSRPERVAALMGNLAKEGWFEIDEAEKSYLADFIGGWCGDRSAQGAVARTLRESGVLVDPHTAIAIEVALRSGLGLGTAVPIVVAGTASAYKFPRACLEALGRMGPGKGKPGESDLALAAKLAALVKGDLPEPIRILSGAKVLSDRVLNIDEVEPALGVFARGMGRGA
ncbi:MAG: threonine synthase [Spirochaetes bacterium]|nr:threonine synthase [Spirochaetota bacterium]